MQKERAIVVFCDIVGTYGRVNKSNIERQYSIKHFICLLDNLRRFNNSDKIVFCFLSSEESHDVIDCIHEIKENDEYNNLTIEHSFYDNGEIRLCDGEYLKFFLNKCTNKIDVIFNHSKTLSDKYDFDKIYYFDDTELYHMFFSDLNETYNNNMEIISIIPTSLDNLNEQIEENIKINHSNKVILKQKETIK